MMMMMIAELITTSVLTFIIYILLVHQHCTRHMMMGQTQTMMITQQDFYILYI